MYYSHFKAPYLLLCSYIRIECKPQIYQLVFKKKKILTTKEWLSRVRCVALWYCFWLIYVGGLGSNTGPMPLRGALQRVDEDKQRGPQYNAPSPPPPPVVCHTKYNSKRESCQNYIQTFYLCGPTVFQMDEEKDNSHQQTNAT
jgi:hypothetical protein